MIIVALSSTYTRSDAMSAAMFGAYRVLQKIGKGGMADVFLAEDPGIRRQVAIKVLPHEFLRDDTFIKRFEREVHTIAALQHPAILPVYAYGTQDGQPYIVMAYMGGGSLADEIRAQPGGLSYERILRLVERIAEGLDFAHKRGIIHRDFKPSNVLLDEEGNPYIADFGIAKATADTAQLTGSGVVGTPAYMAPEMATSGGIGPGVDVYALGVALYQMITGQMPYTAETPMGVLMAHATAPIPDPTPLRTGMPRDLVQVLYNSLAKQPAQRYQSAGELASDLRTALSGQPIRQRAAHETLVESGTWEMGRPASTQASPAAPLETIGVTTPRGSTAAPVRAQRRGFPIIPLIIGGLLLLALVVGGIFVLPGLLTPQEATPPAAVNSPPTAEAESGPAPAPTDDASVAAAANFGVGLLVDSSANTAYSSGAEAGVQRAVDEFGVRSMVEAASSSAAYGTLLTELIENDSDLLISVGFTMAEATQLIAADHSDLQFAIVDHSFDPPLDNAVGITFEVSEPSFLAGYLAAGVTETGFIATFGGMDLPPVRNFIDYFQAGMNYYNEQKLAVIQVYGQGQFANSFDDVDAGYRIAADLIYNEGTDVIFPAAGEVGLGAVEAARENGALIIGVDTDWCEFRPETCDVVLTSVLKDIGSAVYNSIRLAMEGQLLGKNYVGTLANGGVGLAPYHENADRVSAELQAELDAIAAAIREGSLDIDAYLPQ